MVRALTAAASIASVAGSWNGGGNAPPRDIPDRILHDCRTGRPRKLRDLIGRSLALVFLDPRREASRSQALSLETEWPRDQALLAGVLVAASASACGRIATQTTIPLFVDAPSNLLWGDFAAQENDIVLFTRTGVFFRLLPRQMAFPLADLQKREWVLRTVGLLHAADTLRGSVSWNSDPLLEPSYTRIRNTTVGHTILPPVDYNVTRLADCRDECTRMPGCTGFTSLSLNYVASSTDYTCVFHSEEPFVLRATLRPCEKLLDLMDPFISSSATLRSSNDTSLLRCDAFVRKEKTLDNDASRDFSMPTGQVLAAVPISREDAANAYEMRNGKLAPEQPAATAILFVVAIVMCAGVRATASLARTPATGACSAPQNTSSRIAQCDFRGGARFAMDCYAPVPSVVST